MKLHENQFLKSPNSANFCEAISLEASKYSYQALPLSPAHAEKVVFPEPASTVELYSHSGKWQLII